MTQPPTPTLLLTGVVVPGHGPAEVHITGDTVTAVHPPGHTTATTRSALDPPTVLDLPGHLLLPAAADPHAHLDKALTASRAPNPAGDLLGAIEAFTAYAAAMTHDDITARALAAIDIALTAGTTAIRTHVNIDPGIDLRALHALHEVKAFTRGLVDLQIVALTGGGHPLTGRAGAANRRRLEQALASGADVVGGCPHLDPDPDGCLTVCLDAARDHGLPLDLHTDETLDPTSTGLHHLARAVLDRDHPHPVAASHCVSLGMQDPATARSTAALVARAGIAVITLPQTNLYLQARDTPTAPPRGLTALDPLLAAGATVAAGGDNMRDPYNPLGRGDQLDTAALLVAAGHLTPTAAHHLTTTHARAAMGLPPAGPTPGHNASLLAIRAPDLDTAIAAAPATRTVIHNGHIRATTTTQTTITRQDTSPASP